jgi:hypothetical protein
MRHPRPGGGGAGRGCREGCCPGRDVGLCGLGGRYGGSSACSWFPALERRRCVNGTYRGHPPSPPARVCGAGDNAIAGRSNGDRRVAVQDGWIRLNRTRYRLGSGVFRILCAPSVSGSFRSWAEGTRLRNRCCYGELDCVVERTAVPCTAAASSGRSCRTPT